MVPEEKKVGQKPSLRGLLYRRIVERKPAVKKEAVRPSAFPKFIVKKAGKMELPRMPDVTKINVSYPLLEPYASVNIVWDGRKKELLYNVIEPILTEDDKAVIRKLSDILLGIIDIDLSAMKEGEKVINYLEDRISQIAIDYDVPLTTENYPRIMYYIYRNFVGLNEIEPLMQDPNIEDISCDGIGIPLYIIHRRYGSMISSVSFNDLEYLREFILKLAERCGRYVSYAEPILDASLPDGSRVAATLASDVATRGATFTLRKFSEHPFSPVEIIDLNTASADIMGYMWYLIEHKASGIVVGGTATGKTSFLNSLAMFIPPEAKIVSIEDTRELRLSHQHWISGLARVGFGVPSPTGEKYGEVTLFDLLRETFRQNPDYVIVGETRGEETYVMFQGMASGHSSLSTFHAGSLDTFVKRITTEPINLSPTLLESLNFLIIMTHAKEKAASARRVKEIVEIISVDPRSNEIATNITFRWDPVTDKYERVNDSVIVRRIASNIGASYEDAAKELDRRVKMLNWLAARGVADYSDFTRFVNDYYKEPESVYAMVEGTAPPSKPETTAKTEEKPRRVSILDLLGFRVLREKKNA